jgi:SSS family solute:Na+ symporter
MLVLTLLVGGISLAASLSRVFLPAVSHPDEVIPLLARSLLPHAGMELFILAVVSASLSTATALYHIAAVAVAEDLPARKSTPAAWFAGVLFCVLISASCAQIKGQIIAILCTTSWSMVGATALVPYLALVLFRRRNPAAAWASACLGVAACLAWYLLVSRSTALVPSLLPSLAGIPPFFAGIGASLFGWAAGSFLGAPSFRREAGLPS